MKQEPKYTIGQRLWCMAQVEREDGWDSYITQAFIESFVNSNPLDHVYYWVRTEKGDNVGVFEHMLFETKAEVVSKWKYIYRRDGMKAIETSKQVIENELGVIRYERERMFKQLRYLDEQA